MYQFGILTWSKRMGIMGRGVGMISSSKSFFRFNKSHVCSRVFNDNTGNTLISVMISFGLMGIMAASFMSLIEGQRKQIKFLEQKTEINDLKNILSLTMQNPAACQSNLDASTHPSLVFDSTQGLAANRKINLMGIKLNGAAGPDIITAGGKLNSGVIVDKIEVAELTDDGSGKWDGFLRVKFLPSGPGMIQPKDLKLYSQKFSVDLSVMSAAKITGCPSSLISTGNPYDFTSLAGQIKACYLPNILLGHFIFHNKRPLVVLKVLNDGTVLHGIGRCGALAGIICSSPLNMTSVLNAISSGSIVLRPGLSSSDVVSTLLAPDIINYNITYSVDKYGAKVFYEQYGGSDLPASDNCAW